MDEIYEALRHPRLVHWLFYAMGFLAALLLVWVSSGW